MRGFLITVTTAILLLAPALAQAQMASIRAVKTSRAIAHLGPQLTAKIEGHLGPRPTPPAGNPT